MIKMTTNMRSTAIAALLTLPLATGVAVAQQAQATDQAQQPTTSTQGTQGTTGQQSAQSGGTSAQTTGEEQSDALVATVGEAEIRGSDVLTVIGMLPPRLQSQPPQLLVPIALDQLILRELILEQARAQSLAEDPEVVALVAGSAQGAEEDAMVQVWIDREMANVVTDAAVMEIYGTLQPQGQQPIPPIEALRPQIEQHLRQQAIQEIQNRLQQDAAIVLYDPSGQPLPPEQQIQGTRNTSSDAGGSGSDQSGGGSTDGASDGQSGGD